MKQMITQQVGAELARNMIAQYGFEGAKVFPTFNPERFDELCAEMQTTWP